MKNRIGIVGGGQLGRMLTFEAKRLGFIVNILDPTPGSPAGQVADRQIVADFKDQNAIKELAKISDYLTFEIELANSKILDLLETQGIKVNPSAKTLDIIKDKLRQKLYLRKANIPVAEFVEVKSKTDIIQAADKFGYPILLKARFDSYDGRGNFLIKNKSNIELGIDKLKGRQLYVEKYVSLIKELAIMVARSTNGEIVAYPVVETVHKNNICQIVFAPAQVEESVQVKAGKIGTDVMKHLNGAGVFGIEMFYSKNGNVLVNEIAPRVHNSGHFSIEACITNQFEQQIRAITGLPLGSTEMIVPVAVMVNILGERTGSSLLTGLEKALSIPNVFVHVYGKYETKIERKMGHITAIDKNVGMAYKKAIKARRLISI